MPGAIEQPRDADQVTDRLSGKGARHPIKTHPPARGVKGDG
jgi:hypothetical protein